MKENKSSLFCDENITIYSPDILADDLKLFSLGKLTGKELEKDINKAISQADLIYNTITSGQDTDQVADKVIIELNRVKGKGFYIKRIKRGKSNDRK
jgi:hypothetical protein